MTASSEPAPRETTAHTAIHVDGLTKAYASPEGSQKVLSGMSLSVAEGESIAVLGVSGTGKSTLLNVLGGIDSADSGSVTVAGQEITGMDVAALSRFRAEKVGFIFQFYNLIGGLTAFENVLTALQAQRRTTRQDERRCSEMLDAVGIGGKADKFPDQLSGGEQQRVAIARALVKSSPVVLADEPTGNLDPHTADSVMQLLTRCVREANAVLVLVTHDGRIRNYVDRTYALRDGRLESA
ncbi:MAG: ABC transporter ATP-binding protein [Ectothiorhodospiraceae bacterium]|jgi:putative ABC transport system ATP-binding protein